MSAYATITSIRTTPADPAALLTALRSATDSTAGVAMVDASTYRVKKATAFSPADLTACQSAVDNCAAVTPESIAQTLIDTMPIATKALLLTLLDQINLIRSKLPTPLAAITPAQAIQAVRDKAGTL